MKRNRIISIYEINEKYVADRFAHEKSLTESFYEDDSLEKPTPYRRK